MGRPAPDTTVRRTLRTAGLAGLVLGTVVVLLLLVVGDEDVDVVVWGGSLLLGILGTLTGLVFAAMTRVVGRGEQRALGKQHAQESFLPAAVGLERSFLYLGVPLLVTGLMLSVSLVLQGENLF